MTGKDLKLFYSTAEVAEIFSIPESTLRFWERQFPRQIAPHKSGRGVRQYTAEDIEKVRIIHSLVKVRGLKIAAARELLKNNKTGTRMQSEMLSRLQNLREELLSIREELSYMRRNRT
ncbi:MAG: MerR family transcriptional regulator [Bacteroidaceae bacterium]|nr:MerR family transcriptional regulator [Bacteroidaceae bacterium]